MPRERFMLIATATMLFAAAFAGCMEREGPQEVQREADPSPYEVSREPPTLREERQTGGEWVGDEPTTARDTAPPTDGSP